MSLFGLGKGRSKLGIWIDRQGISQLELVEKSGVSRNTISRLCNDESYQPNMKTARKIIRALRHWNAEISANNFWDL
jgi:putative transcriptional regulator